jgi:glyoxylase I family protein
MVNTFSRSEAMTNSFVEHVNITVSDPQATAGWLCRVFGWDIRWRGEAIYGGTTIHVGSETSYLAVYSIGHALPQHLRQNYHTQGGLNHIGIVVEDLDATESRVKAEAFTTHSHADYKPGHRFYFRDGDGVEFEVVAY